VAGGERARESACPDRCRSHVFAHGNWPAGRAHTVPVVPVERDGKRWVVAPYGPVAWVHNARALGRVSLRYGRSKHAYAVREATADEAGPVLKRYVAVASKTRQHFRASPDAPSKPTPPRPIGTRCSNSPP
jgi:hypothetical protein